MSISAFAAAERVEFAERNGYDAACKKFGITHETLGRYRRQIRTVERDADDWSDLLGEKKPIRWDDWAKLDGDWLITNDWQLPFFSFETWAKALKVARRLNLKKLLLNGDVVDFDRISSYDTSSEQYSTVEQLVLLGNMLDRCLEWFDEVFITMGNHDIRIIRLLKKLKNMANDDEWGAVVEACGGNSKRTPFEIFKDFVSCDGKVTLSEYPLCEVAEKFVVCHPAAYSRLGGKTERELAGLWRKHVFGAHGHLFGMMFEPGGFNFGIQPGAMTEGYYHRYKNMSITTHPNWQRGFGWIKDGKGGFYLNHPDFYNILDIEDDAA